ncbi:MAG: hypothetical protein IJV65_07990, partial [Kiritimatiellae bacterium]|nr:hypothetical protein [Kiritimatiellia bacterium]
GALLGYRRLAAAVRESQGLGDPCPASLLVAEEPAAEKRLPPLQRALLPDARRAVRKRLADPGTATVKAFAAGLRPRPAEPRDRMRRLAEAAKTRAGRAGEREREQNDPRWD